MKNLKLSLLKKWELDSEFYSAYGALFSFE